MPVTDDEIHEKYLERAIRESNAIVRDVRDCTRCPRGDVAPVVGSGHPMAEVFLLKHRATDAEVAEGVAFHGPSGAAVLACLRALDVDPAAVYGTVCVKCPQGGDGHPACVDRVGEELAVVQPRLVVIMGEPALRVLNGLELALAQPVGPEPGVMQSLTPVQDALFVPDVDASLEADAAKRAFWSAFRPVGEWWAARGA